tara:strand:- start:10277 stop:10774 length:498 start_codon:yes stop_codon:yes gene_type:complete
MYLRSVPHSGDVLRGCSANVTISSSMLGGAPVPEHRRGQRHGETDASTWVKGMDFVVAVGGGRSVLDEVAARLPRSMERNGVREPTAHGAPTLDFIAVFAGDGRLDREGDRIRRDVGPGLNVSQEHPKALPGTVIQLPARIIFGLDTMISGPIELRPRVGRSSCG